MKYHDWRTYIYAVHLTFTLKLFLRSKRCVRVCMCVCVCVGGGGGGG